MEINNRHKTLIDLWKSSFLAHNDLIKKHSTILENKKRTTTGRQIISKEELFPALIAAQALQLSIFKEKVIEKDKYDNNLLIDKAKFDSIISKVITIQNNKAYIGELEFENEIDAFVFIRNKLLHGEYYIKDDKIYLEKDNKEASIVFHQLTTLVLRLQLYMETTVKSKNTCLIEPLPNTSQYSMKERLEKGYFNVINVHVRKKGNRKTSFNDLKHYTQYVLAIRHIMMKTNTSFEQAIEIFKTHPSVKEEYALYTNYFLNNHMQITYEKIPIAKHPKYKEIKQTIINDNNAFYNMDKKHHGQFDQENFFPLIENIINDNSQIITTNALQNYISALSHYILNDGQNIYEKYGEAQAKSITFLDDISLISEFVCFYAKFHYGLDELLSDGKNTSLAELLSNEKLDFTSLSFDDFDDPNMTTDIKLTSIAEQAKKIRKDYQKAYESFERQKKQLAILFENPNVSGSTLEKVSENMQLAKNRYFKLKQMVEKLETFDFNKYERYINLVNHVRNAFAHGNVSIKPYTEGDTLKDRKIHIVDIYDGKVTYEKEMTYEEFGIIFKKDQNSVLKDFVENIATEENASRLLRDMSYEYEDQEHRIREDRLEGWQNIIEEFRRTDSSEELTTITLAYCQMKTLEVMKDNFTVEEFCQNTIHFINFYKEKLKADALELDEYFDEDSFDFITIYHKIMFYVIRYCNNCPEELKKAFQHKPGSSHK